MKVLQVNSLYKNGSTGKITFDLHTELLNRGIESIVCYGRGKKITEACVYKTCGELYSKVNHLMTYISGVMYGGCYFSTKKLIKIIKKENPDIVHLQCINGYFVNIYRLIEWLKSNNIRTVVTLHAEFMYTGGCGHAIDCNQWRTSQGCGHIQKCPRWRRETKSWFFDRTGFMWKRMKQAFDGFDKNLIVVSVSPWLMQRASIAPIFQGKKHRVILNGLDTSVFHRYNADKERQELGLTDEKIILHVTPSFNLDPSHIKGGYYVNELAKKFINKNVKFLIAGPSAVDSGISKNIILLGKVADQRKLAKLYSLSDATLLTSKKETFSMVTAESLCCGTPVIGFKAGAPEQIALKEYSVFVEYGDINMLEKSMSNVLSNDYDNDKICQSACLKYGKINMCDQYMDIYQELCT